MQENIPSKISEAKKNSPELLERSVAGIVNAFVKSFERNGTQRIFPLVDVSHNDLVVRRAPARWIDRARDGRPMQAIGQAVLLMRDNHGEIFTVWSNGAVTYEEVDHADVPAITLKLQPPPPQRLKAIADVLGAIGENYF